MRSVSMTSTGTGAAINGALENLDKAIDQFDGGSSSDCSSSMTTYTVKPSTVSVQIVVHEPSPPKPDQASESADDRNDATVQECGDGLAKINPIDPCSGCKKDSGYGSQGILKIDRAVLGKATELGRNTPSPTAIVPKDEKDLEQFYERLNLNEY